MYFPVFFIYWILLMKQQLSNAERPYTTELESFQSYTNTGTEYFEPKTLRVNRKGRNKYSLTGEFCLNSNLGEDSMMTFEFLKKSETSEKYSTVMKGGENICQFCATNRNFYPRFRTFTNFPDPKTCPFPKGNYTVNDFTFDDKAMPIAVPSGSYILRTSYNKDGQNMFGYTMNFRVTSGST